MPGGDDTVSLARDNPIEKWDHTFKQVAVRLQQAHLRDLADSAGAPPRHYVLNPRNAPNPACSPSTAIHSMTTVSCVACRVSCDSGGT
jgi:hypothetical protein